jgi:hypothetical protein
MLSFCWLPCRFRLGPSLPRLHQTTPPARTPMCRTAADTRGCALCSSCTTVGIIAQSPFSPYLPFLIGALRDSALQSPNCTYGRFLRADVPLPLPLPLSFPYLLPPDVCTAVRVSWGLLRRPCTRHARSRYRRHGAPARLPCTRHPPITSSTCTAPIVEHSPDTHRAHSSTQLLHCLACVTLCCTAFYCTVLYCVALYCTVLYCPTL